MQKGAAEYPGHVFVHFHHQLFGNPCRGGSHVIARSECKEARLVHGGNGGNTQVDFHVFPAHLGNLVQVRGDEIIETYFYHVSFQAAHKPGVSLDTIAESGIQNRIHHMF